MAPENEEWQFVHGVVPAWWVKHVMSTTLFGMVYQQPLVRAFLQSHGADMDVYIQFFLVLQRKVWYSSSRDISRSWASGQGFGGSFSGAVTGGSVTCKQSSLVVSRLSFSGSLMVFWFQGQLKDRTFFDLFRLSVYATIQSSSLALTFA